jgi:hypothetical protein
MEALLAFWMRRWLSRPEPILRRLEAAFEAAGETLDPNLAPEFLTVVGTRAAFVADVITWILIQFITIYGLVLMVLTGRLAYLAGFAVVSLGLLGVTAPAAARVTRLIFALRAAAGVPDPAAGPRASD